MKFIVIGRVRESAGPDEQLRMIGKFAGWQPPGYELETLLLSADGRLFGIANADSVGVIAEGVAQFSTVVDFEIVPVDFADNVLPKVTAGYEWARS